MSSCYSTSLFVPAVIVCERTISGTVECDGERISGAMVFLSASNDIVSFSENPVITDENGHFEAVVFVSEGTEPTELIISASTIINDREQTVSLPTIVRCLAEPCILLLFGPESIDCNDVVSGRARCGNTFIQGVEVTLTADPPIINFDPNPAITGSGGNYFSGVSVPSGTPPTEVEITASAIIERQPYSEFIFTTVSCESDCSLTLTADPLITCEGEVSGFLTCDGVPIEGATIDFSDFPNVGNFDPDPTITAADGSFSTTLIIPEGTPLLSTAITATATVNDLEISSTIGV